MGCKENDMDATREDPIEAAEGAEKADILENIAKFYTNGIERLAEVQKKAVDLAAQQNLELINTWKKQTAGLSAVPGIFLLDLAASAFDHYAEAQKGAIELLIEQSHVVADMVKERNVTVAKAVEGGVTMVQETIERAV